MNEIDTMVSPSQAGGSLEAPSRLRQAREAAGLHIAALAAALKVPVKKLEALEAGRYDELPDMTFARALAASACRQLKIDPAFVLEQIPSGVRPPLGGATVPINAPFKSGDDQPGGAGVGGLLLRPAAWGVGLLLLAAIAMAMLPEGWVNRIQMGSPVAPETVAATPASVVELATPSVDAPQPNPQPGDANPATVVVTAPDALTAAPVAPTPVAAEPTPVASGPALLSIRAVNESWIEVINGSGAQVVQRVLKPDETIDFSSAAPYSVVVGRADAVRVSVRGEPFDLMPLARNGVARFEVK